MQPRKTTERHSNGGRHRQDNREDGKRQPMEVKGRRHTPFDKYSGSKIKMENEEYLIIKEEDILGIVEG